MKKSTFVIFVTYVWTQMIIGLIFHPFSSVWDVIRKPVLLPVIFSPFLSLLFLFITGRIGALLVTFYGISREIVAIFLSTVLVSVLLWQALLIYFLGMFVIASLRE